ncbi:PAS domain S-box protein [Nodosilinea sp. LEGE 07298]|uniref:PAS domain S-box protein n=1 Tax=Nodosilinea sp. LEGE 07298 TaxID=2777970 RepID=UPI00187F272E|nr:PAS domain S-box protein [Nodosilinea sp. LEGE 07298]MBE9111548.1 PAS domain S-box protein [Nodosilinea sp. LEGE 07298]
MDDAFHEVIDHQVSTIVATATVAAAIAQLSQVQQPCLVVIEPKSHRYLGLFTERDAVCLVARGLSTSSQALSAHLQPSPALWQSDLGSVGAIAACFDQHQLPALPVVNDFGQPVGLITLRQLWRRLRQPEPLDTIGDVPTTLALPAPSAQNIHPIANSEQRATLRELQQTKARLELFFTQSLDGFFFMMLDQPVAWNDSIDKDSTLDYVLTHQRITKINNAMLEQYGACREQFMGLTPADFFAHNLEHGRQVWRQFFDAGQLHIETEERKLDGTPIWIEGDYMCLYDEQGNITGHFGVQRNITARKCAEASLRESEARWHLVIRASHDGIFDIDLVTGQGFYSDRFKAMLGYQPHEFANTGEQWVELLHPEDRDRVLTAKAAYLERKQPDLIQEYRIRCRDGSYRWLFDRVLAVWDDTGNPIRVVGTCTNITSRKQAEADLEKRERYLAALVKIQRLLLATKGHHHYYQEVLEYLGVVAGASRVYLFKNHSDAAGRMFMSQRAEWCAEGVTAEIDNPLLQNLPYPDFFPRWGASLSRGESIHGCVADFPESERLVLEPQGIRAVLILPLMVRGELFGFIGFDNCASDYSWDSLESNLLSAAAAAISLHQEHFQLHQKHHQAELALQRQQEFLRNVIDNPPNLIFAKDWQGRFVLANQAVASLYDTTVQDLIGKTDADFNPSLAEFEHFLRDDREVISTGKVKVIEEEVTSKTGKIYQFKTIKKPIKAIDGQTTLSLGVATDIGSYKKMEQALRLIVEGTATKTSQDFFHLLVRHLAEVLGVRYALVAELTGPDSNRSRTLAFWQGDRFGDNFEYALTGTPCERVAAGEMIYYEDSIQAKFPQHEHLADLGVESYLGMPLNNALGDVIGHLKVLDNRPIVEREFSEQILRIFAARAGAELERKQSEEAMAALLAQAQDQAQDLKKAKLSAEVASRAKSDFLAHMSHELRTPLNSILGFTQIINHVPNLPEAVRDYVTIINRSGQHLLTLINDVLEMSKIEAGRLKLQAHDFDFYQLLDSIYEMLSLKATHQNLQFFIERSPQLPRYITADEGKLRQVLLNLLGNAIKFTTQGCVVLRIDAIAASDDRFAPITLGFEVEDSGPGIAPDDLPRLFTPFVQTSTGQKNNEGTGLGLTISQKFVQLLGGTITVESGVGQGSTFRFQIPVTPSLVEVPTPVFPALPMVGVHPSHLPCRLLIVEDHWENQQVLLNLLQPLGFSLRVANHGREAIDLWAEWYPHGILMDMRMPIMDGYEAIQHIRARERKARMAVERPPGSSAHPMAKIIAVTSSAFDQERADILEAGCDDFISKPFQEQDLLAKLAQHLGLTYLYAAPISLGKQVDEASTAVPPGVPHAQSETLTLEGQSRAWIDQLHRAAVLGRDTQILKLIAQLPATQADLIQALTRWAQDFHFEQILALTRAAGHD